ncbi:jg15003 [Pararge aegeria aegeria]|uniref:Jg15003 protein n=1 Tax=Pararge aegeria aegeria TaxID=348720 RepID=A0A8S4QM20_9NEOP|nr:jg15003 [Pararge aegeria aegeria]
MIEERECRQRRTRQGAAGELGRLPAPACLRPRRHAKAIIGAIGSALYRTAPQRSLAMQINSEAAAAGHRCPSLLFDSRGMAFMSLMEK